MQKVADQPQLQAEPELNLLEDTRKVELRAVSAIFEQQVI